MSPALAGGFFTTELPGRPLEPGTNLCDATWRGQVWRFCQQLSPPGWVAKTRRPLSHFFPGEVPTAQERSRKGRCKTSDTVAEVVTDLSFRGKSDGTWDLEKKWHKGKETENKRGRQEWRERKTGGREEWSREEKEESKMLLFLPLHPVKGKGEKKRYIHLNAEFQKLARRDTKPFSVINAKKWSKTIERERRESSSRKLEITRKNFIVQRWAQ